MSSLFVIDNDSEEALDESNIPCKICVKYLFL